jgi:hypothetical protein
VDGRTLIRMDLRVVGCGLDISVLDTICEHSNEPSGFIKGGEFLDQLSDHKLLKNDSALPMVLPLTTV